MHTDADFAKIYEEAWAAGVAAANANTPQPMVVTDGRKNYYVADGLCGFAWVIVKPATSRFARWLKEKKGASSAYGGGLQIWIGDYNQSVSRKEAHARAMAKVLQEKLPELKIRGESRLD